MDTPVRILIADDDDVCRELVRDVITEEKGIDIVLASDGADALKKIQASPVDILITDLNMPHMDGLTLVSRARKIYPHIVSIIITGYGSLESAVEAIQQGAYDYVQKPFKLDRIAVVARNAIEKIRLLRDRDSLTKELESAYNRLRFLEPSSEEKSCETLSSMTEANGDSFMQHIAHRNLPLYFLEIPDQASSQVLAKLERLRELKREGAINDTEFSVLKRAIIHQLGPKES